MAAAGLAASKLTFGEAGKLTAGEVVERIKKNNGIPWISTGFRDYFHLGGPDTVVHGIGTSFGGNLDVLQRSLKQGLNMVIVHEPTLYSDADVVDWVASDPLYKYKLDWANKNNVAVWRIHDNWHAHKPDGIQTGWDKAIGWNQYKMDGQGRHWKLPPTTLSELAKYVAKTLSTRSLRMIGDPNLPVTIVARGGHPFTANAEALPDADCILVSETREYDSFEYVRDTVLLGDKKGAIFMSHQAGEDEGMRYFAEWSQPFLPEVPVKFVPTGDQFWTV